VVVGVIAEVLGVHGVRISQIMVKPLSNQLTGDQVRFIFLYIFSFFPVGDVVYGGKKKTL
jgi:hypothetical protein